MSIDNFLLSSNTTDLNYPEIRPTLDLNFARVKALDPRITFTRASGGSYVGADGLIKLAGVNEPRFDHDPYTGESLGLLVEEARTNLITYSEQFDNAAWTKSFGSISTNTTTAPDGTLTADKFINDSSNSEHYITGPGVTFAPLTTGTTFSCFAKAAEFSKVAIGYPNALVVFDLTNGTIFSTTNAFSFTLVSSIQSFPGGWYRCSIAVNTNGTPFNPNLTIWMADASGNRSYAGDGISGIFLWGAQLEAGSFPTSYIPTEGSSRTRAADVASITGANFSSWYNYNASTIVIDGKPLSLSGSPRLITMSGGGGENRLWTVAQDFYTSSYASGGGGQVLTSYAIDATSFKKYAYTFDYNSTSNLTTLKNTTFGQTVLTNTASGYNIPLSGANLHIGSSGDASGHKWIRRLTYYPKRLTDAQLQVLTR